MNSELFGEKKITLKSFLLLKSRKTKQNKKLQTSPVAEEADTSGHIRTDYSLTEQRAFGSGAPGWKRETQHGKLTPTEEPDSS